MQTEITQTIIQKVPMLSEEQQKDLLAEIEILLNSKNEVSEQANETTVHPLTLLGKIQIDCEYEDLAENHDFYAHRKVED